MTYILESAGEAGLTPGPDAKGLAQKMAQLKTWARDRGYYNVPLWEQALRTVELIGAPVIAYSLLTAGGLSAALGCVILGVHYPRTAYLGHDVTHNQWGPRDDLKPRIMTALVSLFQGFGSTWWVEKHELHHSFPNACRMGEDGVMTPIDGDIDSPPWLIWDKDLKDYNDKSRQSGLGKALSFLLPRFQVQLFFPILSIARFNWSWQSMDVAFRRGNNLEGALCVAHWVLGVVIAMAVAPTALTGLLWFIAAQFIGGFILAFVFVLNHTGMEVYDATKASGFYDRQARSTRNTPSSAIHDWLCGGLNSQIEHHMFPTMARRNLPKMREATKRVMQECGYAYEELGNSQAMQTVLRTLSEAARA